jgi:uncharacterized protein (DUF486 family)
MPEQMNAAATAPQSSFVTGLAWTLIVFNALGVLVLLLQNVAINVAGPALLDGAAPAGTLALSRSVGIAFLAIAVFLTYAAYALLKRRNWARVTYVVALAIAIVSHVLSAFALGIGLDVATSQAPPGMENVMKTIVLLLGMCVVFVWLIRRLRSPEVKAEFTG